MAKSSKKTDGLQTAANAGDARPRCPECEARRVRDAHQRVALSHYRFALAQQQAALAQWHLDLLELQAAIAPDAAPPALDKAVPPPTDYKAMKSAISDGVLNAGVHGCIIKGGAVEGFERDAALSAINSDPQTVHACIETVFVKDIPVSSGDSQNSLVDKLR